MYGIQFPSFDFVHVIFLVLISSRTEYLVRSGYFQNRTYNNGLSIRHLLPWVARTTYLSIPLHLLGSGIFERSTAGLEASFCVFSVLSTRFQVIGQRVLGGNVVCGMH